MKTLKANLFNPPESVDAICITTNGTVKKNGELVMGRGCALQATQKWNGIAKELGSKIKLHGNHVHFINTILRKDSVLAVLSFPVKHNWHENADLTLIKRSAYELKLIANTHAMKSIWIPAPGCGNGHLKWSDVEPVLDSILDERFTIIFKE